LLSSSLPEAIWGVCVPPSVPSILVTNTYGLYDCSKGSTELYIPSSTWLTACRFQPNYGFFVGDGAGNIFKLDNSVPQLKPLYTISDTFVTALDVDPAKGDIYFIVELYPSGTAFYLYRLPRGGHSPKLLMTLPFESYGLAIRGNSLYITDFNDGVLYRTSKAGGKLVPVPSGFNGPTDIVADAGGNLYLTEWSAGNIVAINSGATKLDRIATGFFSPLGIGVDAQGNLYFTEEYKGTLWKLERSFPK